jgi:large subunit ribosomal protein L22
MADETQAGDPTPDEPATTEATAAEPTATAEEPTVSADEPTPSGDGPTAGAEEPATAASADTAEPTPVAGTDETVAKPAAKATKPGAGAKATSPAAAKAKKPASAKPPAAEKAKPARPGLRGRVKTRGRGRKTGDAPTELPVVRAQAKYVRTSARKARLVCDHIRGKSVAEAQAILAFAPRAVAQDWAKLLKSAVANAENNHELLGEDLRVKEAFADEGPTLKRFRPRAMGRATPIRKRTSHLTITLTPKE